MERESGRGGLEIAINMKANTNKIKRRATESLSGKTETSTRAILSTT